MGLVPLVATSYRLIDLNRAGMDLSIRERHLEQARGFAARIDMLLLQAARDVTLSVYNEKFESQSTAEKKVYLGWLMEQYPELEAMTLVEADGTVHHAFDISGRSLEEIQAHAARIDADRALAEGRISYSEVYASRRLGQNRVNIIVPSPRRTVVVAAEVTLKRIQEEAERLVVGRSGVGYVIDRQARLVAHPRRELAVERAPLVGRPEIEAVVAGGVAGSMAFSVEDDEYLASYCPVAETDWLVVVEQPAEEAFESSFQMTRSSLLIALVAGTVAFLAGIVIARRISEPIYALVRGAVEYARGNLEYRVDEQAGGEIGTLTRTFNELGRSLDEREQQLSRIQQISDRLTRIRDPEALLEAGADALHQILPGVVPILALFDADDVLVRRTGQPLIEPPDMVIRRGDALWGELERAGQGEILNEWPDPGRGALGEGSILPWARHLLVLPMRVQDKTTGFVHLATVGPEQRFDSQQLRFAEIVAAGISIGLETIRLVEEMVEKTRIESELQVAELVQKTLMGDLDLDRPEFVLRGTITPAAETGGDYLCYIEDPHRDRIAILVGDVTGHGIQAALLTAATTGFIRHVERLVHEGSATPSAGDVDWLAPGRLLTTLNRIVRSSAGGILLMTFFACVYDRRWKRLTFANAGHPYPLLFRTTFKKDGQRGRDDLTILKASGPILGDEADAVYGEETVHLRGGETIFWNTDGLSECHDPSGRLYGNRRLERLLKKNVAASPAELRAFVLEDIDRHRAEAPLQDDLTFAVGRVGPDRGRLRPTSPVCGLAIDEGPIRDAFLATLEGTDIEPTVVRPRDLEALADEVGTAPIALLAEDAVVHANRLDRLLASRPDVRLLLVADAPLEGYLSFCTRPGFPGRFIGYNGGFHAGDLLSAIERTAGRIEFGIEALHDAEGYGIRLPISGRGDLERCTAELDALATELGIRRFWTANLEQAVSELVINAVKYALPLASGVAEVRLALVPATGDLYFSIADPAGGLTWATALQAIIHGFIGGLQSTRSDRTGAHLGLYYVLRNTHASWILVEPGVRTEAQFRIRPTGRRRELLETVRSFGYFERTSEVDW